MADRWATFDCYGTLIDWEGGIATTFARLWPDAETDALLARYHEIEPLVQHGSGTPYVDVLTEVLRRVASTEGLRLSDDDAPALAHSLPDWQPFVEVPSALTELRESGWRLAILSNTDPELLDSSIANIGVPIDVRITVSEAGSYKPAPGHWRRFLAETGAERSLHVHVAASIFHDIEPANVLGVRSVWINRLRERSDVPRDGELTDLAGLPSLLDELIPG